MSLNWANVKSLAIPVGGTARDVKRVSIGGAVVWEKPSPLPYDAEVEYLESTGTQYVNTGISTSATTRLQLTYKYTSTSAAVAGGIGVSGGLGGNTNNPTRFFINKDAYAQYNIGIGDVADHFGSFDTALHTLTLDAQSKTFTVDNTSYTLATTSFTGGFEIPLFARRNSSGVGNFSSGRLYSCKIWNNGVLVRDFIPVRKGTIGYLYDRVSGQLFGNAGTGDFVLGPDIERVSYIKTDGAAWIDTGFIVPNLGSGFEITMSCPNDTSKSGWNRVFLGAGNSSTSYTGPMWNFINSSNSYGGGSNLNIGVCIGNKRPINRREEANINIVNALFSGDFNTLLVPNNSGGNPYTPPWYVNGTAYISIYAALNTSGSNALPSTTIAVFGSHVGTSCVNKITADFKLRELKWFAQSDGSVIAHFSAAKRGSEYGLLDEIAHVFKSGADGTILGG